MSPPTRPSLRIRLGRTLVGLGLTSVLLLAGVNFFVVRSLLDTSVRNQLVSLRQLREDAIESGMRQLLARVSVMASDPGLVGALQDLETGYQTLDDISAAEIEVLESAYADVVAPYDAAGVERPEIAQLVPATPAGRYVQYHYVATNPHSAEERERLLNAGDGTDYSAAHARHHGYLSSLRASIGASDLLLVASATDEVVYSTAKRIDLGTDILDGPYRDSGLGTSIARLDRVAATDAVVVDSEFYFPDTSAPVAHIAANIRADTEIVGQLVIGVPIAVLTEVVTAGGRWDLLGLGDTGDAYVVGPELRLRTVPRAWFEDPEGSLVRFRERGGDERVAGLIQFTGSPVLLQPVDNAAVRAAFDGDEFVGTVDNHLGHRTLASAAQLELPGLDWVIVTEQQTGETRDELERYLVAIGGLLLVLLPILAVVGVLLARALARPVDPLVAAARRIADGDLDTEVPALGRNELGDVGMQLGTVARRLREHEQRLADEEARIEAMLASVLPAGLIDRVRGGELDVADVLATGTVIALSIHGIPTTGADLDTVLDLTARLAADIDALARDHGVERIRVAFDQQLFVAGRDVPDAAIATAVAFALDAAGLVESVGAEHGAVLTPHLGLAAGPVATGVLGTRQVSFGMWGECVGVAVALSEVAPDGAVVADHSVVDELDSRWSSTRLADERRTADVTGLAQDTAVPDAYVITRAGAELSD